MKLNLPTKITVFRILLIPIILFILLLPFIDRIEVSKYLINIDILSSTFYWPNLIALILFIIASLTDAIDGYIARKYNLISNLGKFLDPVADKLLVNSLLIYLAFVQNVPVILVIIMISRDIIVDALRMIAVENDVVIAASIYGKLKTVFQMVLICLLLLFTIPFEQTNIVLLVLAYITTLISIISGIDYFIKNGKTLKN